MRWTKWMLALAMVAVLLPGVAHAKAKDVYCGAWLFDYSVPSSWSQLKYSCPDTEYVAPDGSVGVGTSAEKHGYWNDVRAKSSIKGDLKSLGTLLSPVALSAQKVGGRRYVTGGALLSLSGDREYALEWETYANGNLYKFYALLNATNSNWQQTLQARAKAAGQVMGTLIIVSV